MYKLLKRAIDLLIVTIVLILLSPVFIPVMIILLLTGEHEVFYLQKRVGYKNKPFYIWKFATMQKGSSKIGTGEITLRNDPRVTRFGKFLRISKINELPQVINVFKGNMSIVGPRPLMQVSFDLYTDEVKNKIYNSKPGITGIGSLIFRDEEKIISEAKDPRKMYASIYPYKGELELWYCEHASTYTDILIIFLTAWSIIFPHNHLANAFFKDLPQKD
ncbi:MAG: sugar transferase [Bacteroidota bacterium]|jgi:lipopolysaccharide/colanic/teichoic acid biosynthesis glycosyltransferase|nr:sugar transferase [Bacteroidota bacterium]